MAVAVSSIVAQVINQVVQVVNPLGHLSYLVYCRRNVNDLRNQMERLGKLRTDVERSVDVARSRGQVIKEVVKSWLDTVDAIQRDLMEFNGKIEEHNGCFRWDFRARYLVGREAKSKTDVVNNLQKEGQFDTVSIPPPSPPGMESMPMPNFQVFEPTDLAMKQIMEAFEDKKLNFVGVYGMGGVGKTTLMKEIVKELKNKGFFDEVVMVTVSQDLILKKIQDDIAENLGFKLEEANESVRARRLLVRIAQEKRILIILDDLWDPLTLTEVGIPYEDREDIGNDVRGFKCCVIIATRFIEVCDQMNTQYNVEVKVLPEADAWQLFRTSAGDCVDSTVFHEVAREVVKECGGLPVALVTIGKALRNKDQIVWIDAVTQLKKSIPSRIPGMQKEVFSSIKLSYDYLEIEETRRCFLFCCLFPEDFIISEDDLLPYVLAEDIFEDIENMKEAKNRLHTVLDTLKRSCLLLNVDEKEGCVRMHDIVRDVAISIASLEDHGFVVKAGIGLKEWPNMEILRKCKQLSLMQNKISKLPEQMGCSQLKTLSLRDNRHLREIPDECFKDTLSLKVLDLRNTNIVSIPSSFSWLMELRVLHINIVGSSDLSLLGNMKKLEILDLSSSKIRTLPQEIGGFTNLKSLRLSRVFFMIIPPKVLSRLSLLEELDLFYSFDKWVPEGSEDISKACLSEVASLASLKKLKLGISNIECLSSPISLCAENLTQFLVMIYATPRPNSYEMFYGTLNVISEGYYAAKMSFSEITFPKLSNWVKMLLERTEELDLIKCHGPKNIYPELSGGSGLNNLQSLKIQVCGDLEHILSAEAEGVPILAISKLEELQLEDIGNLRKICHGRFLKGSLENLRILSIDRCSNLKHIFQMSMAEGLPQLEEIQILSCESLEKIFMKNEAEDEEGKVLLPRLRVLELVSLPNFSMVCQGLLSVHDLPHFERLCIYECPNLKRLPLSLSPKSTPRLREIKVEKTWFNQLEWDEISNKLHIQEWVKVEFLNKSSIFNRTRPCRRTRRPRPR